jgi:hypothetical protein
MNTSSTLESGVETANCSLIDAAKELFNSKIDLVRTDLIIAHSDLPVERDAAKAADASPAG